MTTRTGKWVTGAEWKRGMLELLTGKVAAEAPPLPPPSPGKLICPCGNTVFTVALIGDFTCTACEAVGFLNRDRVYWTVGLDLYRSS